MKGFRVAEEHNVRTPGIVKMTGGMKQGPRQSRGNHALHEEVGLWTGKANRWIIGRTSPAREVRQGNSDTADHNNKKKRMKKNVPD